jgi:acetyltransferase-like isoleucine patch superfamily enzyme
MTRSPDVQIHESADVSEDATVGSGSRIWHYAQIRERACVGRDCIIGRDVYIDVGVTVGHRVKIQNGASLFQGLQVADGVFIGPGAIFANDLRPRAVNLDGTRKSAADWTVGMTRVEEGASIGAGAIVLPGVTIGMYAMIGAGAVVTRDVPRHALAIGNPARLSGLVCRCGAPLSQSPRSSWTCAECHSEFRFDPE